MSKSIFSRVELKFLIGIGSALGLRQLGLIMVMPFMAIYGKELLHSTPGLIGLSLGVFGLSQAVFQIPFGNASDKLGRKPVMLVGLLIFISGLFLAYIAKDIYMFILARVLQGSGAIMAVAYAWVGDVISTDKRNKGMSIISMFVGMSATLAFLVGPVLHRWFTVPELFLICALLAVIAWLFILIFLENDSTVTQFNKRRKVDNLNVDRPNSEIVSSKTRSDYMKVLKDKNLLKLFFAGFAINYLLVSEFFVVPQLLESSLGVDRLWVVFAPATLLGIVVMRIGARYADAGHFLAVAFLSFAAVTVGGGLYFTMNHYLIGVGLTLFMIGYMCLVTLLPATVTKMSQKSYRGTITGVFNTVQFMGSFLGGALTGIVWGANPNYAIGLLVFMALFGAALIGSTKINA